MSDSGKRAENQLPLTHHMRKRMSRRGVNDRRVKMVLQFGRIVHERGATIVAIGKKEVQRYTIDGVDLRDCEGLHVLVGRGGVIVTTYRNHNFRVLRGHRKRPFSKSKVRRWKKRAA